MKNTILLDDYDYFDKLQADWESIPIEKIDEINITQDFFDYY